MPRTLSPLQVGTFVLVALFLGLGMLLFFSTTTLFTSTQTYILYFEDSVKGLSVGSSVKFKGVPIGQVKKIYISYNQAIDSPRVPVLIEIESEQLTQLASLKKEPVADVIQKEIEQGLRAQLQLESFITGLLSIDLNYYPNSALPVYTQKAPLYREIPTIRSPFNAWGKGANDLLLRLSAVDYVGLTEQLKILATKVNQVDVAKLGNALAGSLDSLHKIMAQAQQKDFGASLGELAANLSRGTSEKGEITECLKSVRTAAQEFGSLSAELQNALRGDSAAGAKLYRLVDGLTEASESLSRLADTLEQNPNAILTGKQSTGEAQ